MLKKPKVAIVSLSSCQGCQFAILDLGLEFIELLNYLTIKKFRLLKEDDKNENYDLIFVEGTPIREEEEKMLLKLRAKSKFLVALGNCASMGGIQKIKNYRNRKKVASYVYKYYKTIHNREIKELGKIIKVDAVIPG
ncbi:MAG: NADH:ubiquinone oxidoreductase, partial [Patescibacteria group bacterium]